jgi:hypothetical protein
VHQEVIQGLTYHVCVFFCFGNMALLDALFRQPLCQDIVHALRREGNWVREFHIVLGHSREGDVFGVGEVGCGRPVEVTQQLGELSDSVGAVVEGEDSITV